MITWANKYPIYRNEDSAALEQRAAYLEIVGGLAKAEAEAKAHAEYRGRAHAVAAAYHLESAAGAPGLHTEFYKLHADALGGAGAWRSVSPQVEVARASCQKNESSVFKTHPADIQLVGLYKTEVCEPLAKPCAKSAKSKHHADTLGALAKALGSLPKALVKGVYGITDKVLPNTAADITTEKH